MSIESATQIEPFAALLGSTSGMTSADGSRCSLDSRRVPVMAVTSPSAQQGKIAVVTFWATWRAPCREELPNLEKLQRYRGKEQIAVLASNFKDTPETIRRLRSNAKKAGWNISMLLDPNGRIAQLYDVKAIPRMYLIGKDGKIRATHVGFVDGSLEQMVDELNAVLGEEAATPPAPQSP